MTTDTKWKELNHWININIQKATKAEIYFRNFLVGEKNIKFIFQKGFIYPYNRIVDFYLPEYNLLIEIDGSIHNEVENKLKDYNKDKAFGLEGYKTIRFTNKEVLNREFIPEFCKATGLSEDRFPKKSSWKPRKGILFEQKI